MTEKNNQSYSIKINLKGREYVKMNKFLFL